MKKLRSTTHCFSLRSLLTVLLTAVLLFNAAGCGGNTSTVPTPTASTPTASSTNNTEEVSPTPMSRKDKILNGYIENAYETTLANVGNSQRIADLMKKAQQGGEYTIAVLGGSISAGQGASSSTTCYGYLVKEWWVKNFPNATFKFVNAGLGGTNPQMACYRYANDVEPFNPDFTVVDFAQNTYLDKDIENTYSTLLYKLLSSGSAVMNIYFSRTEPNKYNQMIYEHYFDVPDKGIKAAVEAYDLPALNYDAYVWEYMNKDILWPELYSDYIHPNDQGHKLAANLIALHLEKIKNSLDTFNGTSPELPSLKSDKYINLTSLTNASAQVTAVGDFVSYGNNDSPASRGWRCASNGYNLLKLNLPENAKDAYLLIYMSGTSTLTLTDSTGKSQVIKSSDVPNATLKKIKLDLTKEITFTFEMTSGSGSANIYYIGYEK